MAAGMWQGLLAGYQNVAEKKAAREEKEEEKSHIRGRV